MVSCIEVTSCWYNISSLFALHSSGKVTIWVPVPPDQIARQRVCSFNHIVWELSLLFVSVGDETSFCCVLPSHTPSPASSFYLIRLILSFEGNLSAHWVRPISTPLFFDVFETSFCCVLPSPASSISLTQCDKLSPSFDPKLSFQSPTS